MCFCSINLHPSSSLLKIKGFSESSENDEVSCSDIESDSGFESSHKSKAVSASKGKVDKDEEHRIEKAILYLDEKVCAVRVRVIVRNMAHLNNVCVRFITCALCTCLSYV